MIALRELAAFLTDIRTYQSFRVCSSSRVNGAVREFAAWAKVQLGFRMLDVKVRQQRRTDCSVSAHCRVVQTAGI